MSKAVKEGVIASCIMLLSLLFALGISEVVIRIKNSNMKNYDIEMWRYAKELKVPSKNPVLGHEHVPSSEAVLQSVKIRTNNLGLRGADVDGPPKGRRILFLGSSITLGWGVPEEDDLTSRLEDMLRAAGEEDVEVLNAGIGNYNTVRYVERYLTKLEGLHPTDIVVHYFINDAEELESGGGNWLLQNSELAVTLWIVAGRLFNEQGEKSLVDHYKKVYAPDSEGRKAMEASLQRLAAYARENNIRVFLAMTPDIHNLKNYPFGFIHEHMKKLSAENGFIYVDLLPAFDGLEGKEVWAMPGDPHPNALGYKLMATELLPALLKPE